MFSQGDFQIRAQSYFTNKQHSTKIPIAPGTRPQQFLKKRLLQPTKSAELNSENVYLTLLNPSFFQIPTTLW